MFFFATLIFAVALTTSFIIKSATEKLNIKCQAYVSYRVAQNVLAYDAVFTVRIPDNHRGQFSIEGKLTKGNDNWIINRDVHFKFDKIADDSILIKEFIAESYGRDNIPDDLFRNTFLASGDNLGRVVRISKLMNGYLIGNRQNPEFFCVKSTD